VHAAVGGAGGSTHPIELWCGASGGRGCVAPRWPLPAPLLPCLSHPLRTLSMRFACSRTRSARAGMGGGGQGAPHQLRHHAERNGCQWGPLNAVCRTCGPIVLALMLRRGSAGGMEWRTSRRCWGVGACVGVGVGGGGWVGGLACAAHPFGFLAFRHRHVASTVTRTHLAPVTHTRTHIALANPATPVLCPAWSPSAHARDAAGRWHGHPPEGCCCGWARDCPNPTRGAQGPRQRGTADHCSP
jgi:hypothetical protein